MTARHYYRFDQDEGVQPVPNVLRWSYTGSQNAEEGSAGMYEIYVDDPDMSLEFVGHRRWTVYEDASDDDNEVIIDGLTQAVKIAHSGADITQPIGRVWIIEVADMNTLWTYRVMTGSDAKFPAQSDVERVQQVADSEEMGYFSDLSFLFSGSPVQMDKLNGRGQTTGQIMDQCAQQSGKNWYIYSYGVHGEYSADFGLWYGRDSRTEYTSPLSLSNDPADLAMADVNDGTATTYPIGKDTQLRRDYARQYDGAYGEYANGAKYIRNPAVSDLITVTHRDMVHPAPEIKSSARMAERLNRVLLDHATPDEVISTTIWLPANKASSIRPGMRVAFKATHLPNYETAKFLRVMSAQYKPVADKQFGDGYQIALEMQGPGSPGAIPASCSTIIAATQSVSDFEDYDLNPSVAIVPEADGILIAWLNGTNGNTPAATNMTAISGYTDLFATSAFSRSTFRIATKTGVTGVSSTASASFTTGFVYNTWGAMQTNFQMSSATPVQDKYAAAGYLAVMDDDPTPGNIILVFAFSDSLGSTGPYPGPNTNPTNGPTDWVEVAGMYHKVENSEFGMAIYAHCVAEGEGRTYAYAGAGGYTTAQFIYVGEFVP